MLTLPSPIRPAVRFYGSWQAQYVGPPGDEQRASVGPQVNGGKLMGQLNPDGELVLELNPSVDYHHVRLLGKVQSERYTGRWEYTNASGLANSGTFEATMQK